MYSKIIVPLDGSEQPRKRSSMPRSWRAAFPCRCTWFAWSMPTF